MPLEDVLNACDFLEATGRTVRRNKWVEELRGREAMKALEVLM